MNYKSEYESINFLLCMIDEINERTACGAR